MKKQREAINKSLKAEILLKSMLLKYQIEKQK